MLKRHLRAPLLRRLRALRLYRAITGIPRNEIADGGDIAVERRIELDPPAAVDLRPPSPREDHAGRSLPLPESFVDSATSV